MQVVVDGAIYETQRRGGISRLYTEVLPRMCEQEEQLQITLLASANVLQELPRHQQITAIQQPSTMSSVYPKRAWRALSREYALYKASARSQYSIWHSTYYTAPWWWNGSQVLTVFDMIHERHPHLFGGLGDRRFRARKRRYLEKASAIVAISKTTQQDLMKFYGIDSQRIHVIPLAPSEIFRELSHPEVDCRIPGKTPFLLYLGGRLHYKNFTTLLRAYSRWERKEQVSLAVVGEAWSAEEKRLLGQLRVANRVSLLEAVDDNQLLALYNAARAFVYPSLYEGFGLPLLEAMACGCPVVASDIPSTVEVAAECAIYFEPTDIDGLVAAIEQAVVEGRSSSRTTCGVARAKQFSWDETAARMLEVYRKVY